MKRLIAAIVIILLLCTSCVFLRLQTATLAANSDAAVKICLQTAEKDPKASAGYARQAREYWENRRALLVLCLPCERVEALEAALRALEVAAEYGEELDRRAAAQQYESARIALLDAVRNWL